MPQLRTDFHSVSLAQAGFHPTPSPEGFGPLWTSFASDEGLVRGRFHTCAPTDRWSLSIHDFTLTRDAVLEFELSEYASITWYESISGEEFAPYRRLRAKSLWGLYSDQGGWRGLVHGGIPVRAIGVEVPRSTVEAYLVDECPEGLAGVTQAVRALNDLDHYPELQSLLCSLWPRPGDEHRSAVYYEGKVLEALGLVVERSRKQKPAAAPLVIGDEDRGRILSVMSYIDDHAPSTLSSEELACAACMSATKFKRCFKAVSGKTLTQYVQHRRMSLAEALLHQDDLTIEQIARAVGYSCPSRFSTLFRRETGMLPREWRAIHS